MRIPSESLEYVPAEIIAPLKNGQPYDPTADEAQLAFLARGVRPQVSDWITGVWFMEGSGRATRYFAAALVGPGGHELAPGTYVVWVRITDNPEVPVLEVPEALIVT